MNMYMLYPSYEYVCVILLYIMYVYVYPHPEVQHPGWGEHGHHITTHGANVGLVDGGPILGLGACISSQGTRSAR